MRYHLLTKPAVPGTPISDRPHSTMPKLVSGMRRPSPCTRARLVPPITIATPPSSRKMAPLVTP